MQKHLLSAVFALFTTLVSVGANAQLYCSPYITSPCYRDFYYPGIYQQDIGFACAQQISYYQTTYNELNKAKRAFYYTEPNTYQNQLKSFDKRQRQIERTLGSLKARRDALLLRARNLSGVISQTTSKGYLFQNSKFISSSLKQYNQRLLSCQATLERYNNQIADLEDELQLLCDNRDQFISSRNEFVVDSQNRLSQLVDSLYTSKNILQQCIYTVIQSAYH